jgi:hypothetical protein
MIVARRSLPVSSKPRCEPLLSPYVRPRSDGGFIYPSTNRRSRSKSFVIVQGRLRPPFQSFSTDVRVMGRHLLRIMADQFHYGRFGNPGVFEEADSGMPQRVKTQFVRSTPSAAALVRAPVRCFLAEPSLRQNIRKLIRKIPGFPLPFHRGKCPWMNRTSGFSTDG